MTSTGNKPSTARRPHDAAATRQALLEAARGLFDEVGYDRATTREIGERAGVDPALIARYFDGKEGLFLAAIAEVAGQEVELDYEPAALLATLLSFWDERGHSPISRALASPALTDEMRQRVSAVVEDRLVADLAGELRRRGAPDPELRAELLIAIAVGVAMTRSNGTLAKLAAASHEEVLAVLVPLIDRLGGD
ncbi:MAG TPA: TetR family transcriptional regulator [Solirubrobacterales bacterium]|nr:TetR family transcriptional regulator [Solirubrobacterales bacterium]